jgi:2-oxoglutarate dehydrogenase E1 component
MTPKSLLRHKMSVSDLGTLSTGSFQLIIPDRSDIDAKKTRRIVFCSGKVYYDLVEARQIHKMTDVAIVRIEQIYPFPVLDYAGIIASYPNANDVVWCQEEPQNQGAWYQIRHRLQNPLSDDQQLYYAGRTESAAPASGIFKLHLQQQQALVEAALDIAVKASKSQKPPA